MKGICDWGVLGETGRNKEVGGRYDDDHTLYTHMYEASIKNRKFKSIQISPKILLFWVITEGLSGLEDCSESRV